MTVVGIQFYNMKCLLLEDYYSLPDSKHSMITNGFMFFSTLRGNTLILLYYIVLLNR